MYVGVRAGGGIGDEIEDPAGDPYEMYRIVFDITFFFFVIVILLAIIQGQCRWGPWERGSAPKGWLAPWRAQAWNPVCSDPYPGSASPCWKVLDPSPLWASISPLVKWRDERCDPHVVVVRIKSIHRC